MMNTCPSTPRQLLRYAAGLGLLTVLAVGCATPKVAEMPRPIGATDQKLNPNLEKLTFVLDGKPSTKEEVFAIDPNLIASIHVIKGEQASVGVNLSVLRQDFGSKLDDGVLFAFTKAGVNAPAVQQLLNKYTIKLENTAASEQKKGETGALYQKLVEGKGLTDAEIGGRLILINKEVATAAQLRALPAGTVAAVMTADTVGGREGVLLITTKNRQ